MKHQTLRIASLLLGVLAWVIGAAGAVISIFVGIGAATVVATIGFVLGGFIISAFSVIIMLAVSRMIMLFIDIEEDLAQIARNTGVK